MLIGSRNGAVIRRWWGQGVIKGGYSHSSYNTSVSAMISNKMHESQIPGNFMVELQTGVIIIGFKLMLEYRF